VCEIGEYTHVLNITPKKDSNKKLGKHIVTDIIYDSNDSIMVRTFCDNYLPYIALKYIQSFNGNDVKKKDIIFYIRKLIYPNMDANDNSTWKSVFRKGYKTPMVRFTDDVTPGSVIINQDGENFLEKWEEEFENNYRP
jgi:hypothetical protein